MDLWLGSGLPEALYFTDRYAGPLLQGQEAWCNTLTRWQRADNDRQSVLNAANAAIPQDQQNMLEIAMASAYTLHRARQRHSE